MTMALVLLPHGGDRIKALHRSMERSHLTGLQIWHGVGLGYFPQNCRQMGCIKLYFPTKFLKVNQIPKLLSHSHILEQIGVGK